MCHHLKKSVTLIFEDGEERKLSYYIIKDDNGGYGVKISKSDLNGKELEKCEVKSFTHYHVEAENILEKLASGAVTPMSLKEILTDLFEKRIKISNSFCVG